MNFKNISNLFFLLGFVFIIVLAYLELLPRYVQRNMRSDWQSIVVSKPKNTNNYQKLLKIEKRGKDKNQLGILSIPKIKVKQIVIYDATNQNLALAPALIKNTAYPGTIGNAAIAGHRVSHGFPFRNIHLLKKGDEIIFSNSSGSMKYKVVKQFRVLPNNLSVLKQTPYPQITLLACDPPFSARYRLAVVAKADFAPK